MISLARIQLFGLLFSLSLTQATLSIDYHVDAVVGNDTTGDGSLSLPWRSLSQLGAVALAPGDRVMLKRGSIFRERLEITASGASGNPIVVDAYDTGPAPVISAGSLIPQGASWSGPDVAGEFSLALGPSLVFYTVAAALVRGQPTGMASYVLLAKGTPGVLTADTYSISNVAGQRTVFYRPLAGAHPGDFEFEVSKRNYAVEVTGDWVTVRNIEGLLGNLGHPALDPPVTASTMISYGSNTVFENCRAAFGRSFGIVLAGPEGMIDGCLSEHNNSTGFYVLSTQATNSTIKNSISRFNGNLEYADLDRGGIGVQASFAVIRNNVIHDNGNILDTTGPRIAGDDAISLFDNHGALVMNNFVYNSARGAIRMSHTPNSYGHEIIGNVISNWNLVEQPGTVSTQAIALFGHGGSPVPGKFKVLNNTIYSDQVATTLIGIQLALPFNSDAMRDTFVFNNIVYMPDNTAADSFGIRLVREYLFGNVVIDHNDVLLVQSGNSYSTSTGMFSTAGDFAAALGYEPNALNVDPKFAIVPVDSEDPLSFDLAFSSPLIDAATDAGLVSDFIGRSVPSGLAPDIVAFELPCFCVLPSACCTAGTALAPLCNVVGKTQHHDSRYSAPYYTKQDPLAGANHALFLGKFTHIHNAVMDDRDGTFDSIAQAWNPGDFAILEQVK